MFLDQKCSFQNQQKKFSSPFLCLFLLQNIFPDRRMYNGIQFFSFPVIGKDDSCKLRTVKRSVRLVNVFPGKFFFCLLYTSPSPRDA